MGNDNQNQDKLINDLAGKLNIDPANLKSAAASGQLNSILKNVDQSQADQIQKILNDKEATQKLLSSPQAQMIMKMLQKGK